MKNNKNFICKLQFKDSNVPDVQQKEKSFELAKSTVNHWSKQFAGISVLSIYDKIKDDKICLDANCNYLFTIPNFSLIGKNKTIL